MIAKIIRVSKKYWSDFIWQIIDLIWKFRSTPTAKEVTNSAYSIGVVTYVNRYEIHFLPLIKRLITIFPDTQVVIAINGYYDEDVQKEYLEKITSLLSLYKNVDFISYNTGQSLSKLWNQLILKSKVDKTFIFNDDIKIDANFRNRIQNSGILDESCVIINSSWSHFLITKKIIEKNGWFDERFLGVGYEDHDYEIRLAINGIKIKDYQIKGIKNIVFMTTDFSYGKNIEVESKKYSGVNGKVFSEKWMISPEEKNGFIWVRIVQGYAKLIDGMDTPNFYSENRLN